MSGKADGYFESYHRLTSSSSHSNTLGCLSPAVHSSQPTNIYSRVNFVIMQNHGVGICEITNFKAVPE
jgi:hypothetical protein